MFPLTGHDINCILINNGKNKSCNHGTVTHTLRAHREFNLNKDFFERQISIESGIFFDSFFNNVIGNSLTKY